MTLDGSISSPAAGVGILIFFIVAGNALERRWNPQPPRERYLRRPDDIPGVAFWNILSREKWTEEGLRFHRRRLLFIPIALAALACLWLFADLVW